MRANATANGSRQAAPPQPPLTPDAPSGQTQAQPQPPTQAQQLASTTLAFLQRTQLQGSELDTFATVRGWLVAIAQGQVLMMQLPQASDGGAGQKAS